MITELSGMPEGVIGFEASGKIAAEDYRDVVLPALEKAATAGDVRFVIVFSDFDGMTGGALWQDLKMGVRDWNAWERIALVTDHAWMRDGLSIFSWAVPGEAKAFPVSDHAAAIEWLTKAQPR